MQQLNNNTRSFRTPEKLAIAVGCSVSQRFIEDTVDCLREMDSADLLAHEYEVEEVYSVNLFPFVPTMDEEFLPAEPSVLLEQKAFSNQKPVLLGASNSLILILLTTSAGKQISGS